MTNDLSASIDHWKRLSEDGSFEETLEALEAIVALLDAGELTLDQSLDCFEVGARLSNRCQLLLEQAELRVEMVQQTLGAESTSEPPF